MCLVWISAPKSVYYNSSDETCEMAVHGSLAAFNPKEEDRSEYSERFDFYFTTNEITTDVKIQAILHSYYGPVTFWLIRSLILNRVFDNFSLDGLVVKMKDKLMVKVKEHKEPQPSLIVCQLQFNTRRKHTGKSIAKYVAILHKAGKHCNFGDLLSEKLYDRLVCRIMDTTVQKCLLQKETSR